MNPTELDPEVTENSLNSSEITETMLKITDIYSNKSENTSEYINDTNDYCNDTDTAEDCVYYYYYYYHNNITDDNYNVSETIYYEQDYEYIYINCEYQPRVVLSATIEEFDKIFAPFYTPYSVIPPGFIMALLIIGILGNLVNIFVFTRPAMKTPINRLLAILELVNLFFFCSFFCPLILHYNPKLQFTFANAIFQKVDTVAENAVLSCSNWLTVQIGIWRYVAINWPLRVGRLCGWTRAKMFVIVNVIVSILISIPFAFFFTYVRLEFNIKYNSNTSEEYFQLVDIYVTAKTELICSNPALYRFADALYLLTSFIPCICLAIVTCLLLRSLWVAKLKRRYLTGKEPLRQSEHTPRNESTMEKRLTILLSVLFCFYFFVYVPDTLLTLLRLVGEDRKSILGPIFYEVAKTRIFILLYNSATFFIYLMMSEKFRETLRKTFDRDL